MRPGKRIYAVIAAFAVAFGALWPLVSQAHFGPPEIPSFICSQSGFQHPGAPLPHEDKSHCPLCMVGADFTPPAAAPVPVVTLQVATVLREAGIASREPPFLARPPPSRAPPLDS